jgi:hypothetical protein
MGFGSFRDVEERAGDGRDRDAVANRHFVHGEFAAMHPDPEAPSRPHLPSSWRVDVDLWPVPRQPPERRRALVAEIRPRSHGENGSEPLAALGNDPVTDGVGVAMEWMKSTRSKALPDRLVTKAEFDELRPSHHSVLPASQGCEPPLALRHHARAPPARRMLPIFQGHMTP